MRVAVITETVPALAASRGGDPEDSADFQGAAAVSGEEEPAENGD